MENILEKEINNAKNTYNNRFGCFSTKEDEQYYLNKWRENLRKELGLEPKR